MNVATGRFTQPLGTNCLSPSPVQSFTCIVMFLNGFTLTLGLNLQAGIVNSEDGKGKEMWTSVS